jgi:hypothetical protein
VATDDERPIRIVDRRMFTPEGDLRPDFQPEEASEPPPRPAPERPPAPGPSAPERPRASAASAATTEEPPPDAEAEERGPGAGEPRSDFASLVRSLATTAYSALGLLPDPSGTPRRRDPVVARQMIDWLAVLESKTRGNISFEESDFLARVLYELRLAYVEITRAAK